MASDGGKVAFAANGAKRRRLGRGGGARHKVGATEAHIADANNNEEKISLSGPAAASRTATNDAYDSNYVEQAPPSYSADGESTDGNDVAGVSDKALRTLYEFGRHMFGVATLQREIESKDRALAESQSKLASALSLQRKNEREIRDLKMTCQVLEGSGKACDEKLRDVVKYTIVHTLRAEQLTQPDARQHIMEKIEYAQPCFTVLRANLRTLVEMKKELAEENRRLRESVEHAAPKNKRKLEELLEDDARRLQQTDQSRSAQEVDDILEHAEAEGVSSANDESLFVTPDPVPKPKTNPKKQPRKTEASRRSKSFAALLASVPKNAIGKSTEADVNSTRARLGGNTLGLPPSYDANASQPRPSAVGTAEAVHTAEKSALGNTYGHLAELDGE